MHMKKIIDKLESYIMLVDEFAAGGRAKHKNDKKMKLEKIEGIINTFFSYCILVNEMGAGGRRK